MSSTGKYEIATNRVLLTGSVVPAERYYRQVLAGRFDVSHRASMLFRYCSVQLALIAVLFSPPAVTGAEIQGVVLRMGDGPIYRAGIYLESPGHRPSRKAVTDHSGNFRVSKLPAGEYAIRIAAEGYASWQIEDLKVKQDDILHLPEIKLVWLALGCEFNRTSRVAAMLWKVRRFLFGVPVGNGPYCL